MTCPPAASGCGRRPGSSGSERRGRLHEIALARDAPATRDLLEPLVKAPAIGLLVSLVLWARALQGHAAGVVAERPDLVDVSLRELRLQGQRGDLRALVLDRPSAGTDLLDQRRHDALDRIVREVPLATELDHRQPFALRDRPHRLESLPTRLDPARGPEAAVILRQKLMAGQDVIEEQAAVVGHAPEHTAA